MCEAYIVVDTTLLHSIIYVNTNFYLRGRDMTQTEYEQVRKKRAALWKHLVRRTDKTQRECAERIGIHLSSFNCILTGKTEPKLETLTRIAEALNLPMAAMFPEESR